MLFSSYTFLFQFLPATALAFAAARRHSPRAGIMVLAGASLFFYGAWRPVYLLLLMASVATVSVMVFAIIYRPLVAECFDPAFLRSVGGHGGLVHTLFLVLVVLNMVSGFQALGTLMAVGLMMLPAVAARFWVRQVWSLAALSVLIAFASGYAGLVLSYRFNLPSGPAIVLTAGVFYLASLLLGPRGGLLSGLSNRRHLAQ